MSALGEAVWGGNFDDYQLHRLVQRVSRRLNDQITGANAAIRHVRGAGYQLVDVSELPDTAGAEQL